MLNPSDPLSFPLMVAADISQDPHDERQRKSCLSILFSLFHLTAMLLFLALIIYTLAVINDHSDAVFAVCGHDLWNLLLVHIIMPFILGFIFSLITFTLSPFLLSCTHQNPFWLMLIPLLILMAYSNTMLGLTVQAILKTQNSEPCLEVLRNPTKSISPDTPLIIILSWVFVAIDSIASLAEACFLVFLVGIQLYAFPLQAVVALSY